MVALQYAGTDPEQLSALINATNHVTPYVTYLYDDAGSETLRCMGSIDAGVCNGPSISFLYDGKNQLRRATSHGNTGAVVGSEEYWYDGNGVRSIVVKRDSLGAKTEMIWWTGDVEAHYDSNGAISRVYTYVSMGTPVARIDRTGSADVKVELQFHGLGNNLLATVDRDTGAVDAAFSYAPFGELIEATDGGSASTGGSIHRRRFNDKYLDELTDLAYYGARYYDKLAMTWTQSDPLYRYAPDARWTDPRRGNLYEFSLNNPLRYIDPDGHDVWTRGATNWSRSISNARVQAAWQKEMNGPTTGGGEPGARNVNITSTARLESVQCVFAPGDTGIPLIDVVAEIIEFGPEIEAGVAEGVAVLESGISEAGDAMVDGVESAGEAIEEGASQIGEWISDAVGEAGEETKLATDQITEILKQHVATAVNTASSQGLSRNQADVIQYEPWLERAFFGSNADKIFKVFVERDSRLSGLSITPRFVFGPDVYDSASGVWWDMTTVGQWARHVSSYSESFGFGISLTYTMPK